MFKQNYKRICCGTSHIGKRGQIVIPKDIRRVMNLKAGDKLIIFVREGKFLVMVKPEEIEGFIAKMTEKMNFLKRL